MKVTLADGSRVEITRTRRQPAKVVVTRDKDRWEGTSDDLSKIPEKVRSEVERLLQALSDLHLFARRPARRQGNMIFFGGAVHSHGMPGTIAARRTSEKRLAEMQKQIDDLKQQVKALQGDKSKKE